MQDVKKIRVLVGLNVDKATVEIINKSKLEQSFLELSHKEVKDTFSKEIIDELNNSEDSYLTETGIRTFIDWLKSGKLEMRIYPEAPIHAKVYIIRKDMEKVPDQYGSVITGSSNFSKSGLLNNLEFNVELKDSRDVDYALNKFEELWANSINISDEYIETINKKTWLRNDLTPYELFLKTIYEFFKEEINEDKNQDTNTILPAGFMKLQYQTDAVIQAEKILKKHNGVFISDVVGLGKTFIAAMLAKRLNGRKLIICPPILKDYWGKTLQQFEVSATIESLGKLDSILENKDLIDNVQYIFIDEAHRFRNQNTDSFQKLHEICYKKKVILITATPQNNYSSDIANQLYLFQPKNNSSIPGIKNLEQYFNLLERKLKSVEKGSEDYANILKDNSESIRDNIIRHVMIRRTRTEISEYYKDDLDKQGLKFPQLNDPQKIVYTYSNEIESVFNDTIESIKALSYSRYKPLTYLIDIPKDVKSLLTSQRNMSGFMKSILVKRLESSFYAFIKTLDRFILSYEKFLEMCLKGDIYISKKFDVYDLLEYGDDEHLMDLIENDSIQHYPIHAFNKNFIVDIKNDLNILIELKNKWNHINDDPKKNQFLLELSNNTQLLNKKIIIFTESKETADYVAKYLNDYYPGSVLAFSGISSQSIRQDIEANFNPDYAYEKQDDIRFLVTTDVLAEGINLHRSSVIVNYDLPWNPTKIMQRVGRINRVGTEFDRIFVFNFFPSSQANAHLSLEQNIISKLQSFYNTLGEDSKYLSDEEQVTSYNLYERLNSKDNFDTDGVIQNSDLKYLSLIREIRDTNEKLYEKVKKIPQKSKCGKISNTIENNKTISFMRNNDVKKFFITSGDSSEEIPFLEAMNYFESLQSDKSIKVPADYFDELEKHKVNFKQSFSQDNKLITEGIRKNSNDAYIIKTLKALLKLNTLTEKQKEILKDMMQVWRNGEIPSYISKKITKEIRHLKGNPLEIFYKIYNMLPNRYLEKPSQKMIKTSTEDMKVILSLYLKKGSE